MINAKEEFLDHIEKVMLNNLQPTAPYIIKSIILIGRKKWDLAVLPLKHSDEEFDRFLNILNFEYDNKNHFQTIRGNIWFSNGTWSERDINNKVYTWQHKGPPLFNNILHICENELNLYKRT